MRPQHIGPEEAVRIHQMIRAKKSIGIHWGTFAMGSKEVCRKSARTKSIKKHFLKPYLEPRELLKEQSKKVLNNTEEFCTVNHGETFALAWSVIVMIVFVWLLHAKERPFLWRQLVMGIEGNVAAAAKLKTKPAVSLFLSLKA